jgi:hypothetical protein
MTPEQIDEMSIVVGTQRPPLDDLSIAMFDTVTRRVRDAKDNWVMETVTDVYTTWWDKTKPLMFGDGVGDGVQEMANASSVQAAPANTGDAFDNLAASGNSVQRALDALRADAAAAEAARDGKQAQAPAEAVDPDKTPAPTTDPDFAALEASFALDLPARQHYYEILRRVGDAGIGATEMRDRLRTEGHRTVRQTIQDWLVEDFGYRRVLKLDGGRYRWNPDQTEQS